MQLFKQKRKDFSHLLVFFTSLSDGNLAFHVKDDPKNVQNNHKRLAQRLGYSQDKLIYMKQIHSNDVHCITKDDNFSTPPTCDALVTNQKNTPLMVMMADCMGLLFYDPKNETISVAHAGRAGTFSNIVKNVLYTMAQEFGSQAKDVYVWGSASIGPCCYEVGEDIVHEAKSLGFAYAIEHKKESYFLDISAILYKQLLALGVDKTHINFSKICTSCSTHTYYSYRAQGLTGRFAGVLMLR